MTKDEALKLALEALHFALHVGFPESSESQIKKGEKAYQQHRAAITAIKEALAQPAQLVSWTGNGSAEWRAIEAPTGFFFPVDGRTQPEEHNFCQRCGKRTADLTTIHTCTPPVAAGSQAFYGFPTEPVSTPNAGGKCVTAGETAPTKEIDPNAWAFDRGLEST
jgi:hypothetical protein